jgi:RNA polymerase sigma-70 factor (ECF subfamily)
MDYERISELAAKAISGDSEALGALCEEKARPILYHALKILGNRDDAQDAAQEVLIAICKGIGNLKDTKSFNAWVYTIVLNTCKGFQKKRIRAGIKGNVEFREYEPIEEDRDVLPHAHAEDMDEKNILRRIVSDLPAKRRNAILMYYYDGMAYAEIAEAMGTTISTVSTNIFHAKKMIRKEYERYMKEIEGGSKGVQRGEDMNTYERGAGIFALLPSALHEEALQLISEKDLEIFREVIDSVIGSMKAGASAAAPAGHTAVNAVTKMLLATAAMTTVVSVSVLAIASPWDVPARISPEQSAPAAIAEEQAPAEEPVLTEPNPPQPVEIITENIITETAPILSGLPNETPAPPQTTPTPENLNPVIEEPPAVIDTDLFITFSGGDCECGHVNPKEAHIGGEHSNGNLRWSICEEGSADSLFAGSGKDVEIPLAALSTGGSEISYVLRVHVTDSDGNERTAERWFLLS